MANEKRLIDGNNAENIFTVLSVAHNGSFTGEAFSRAAEIIERLPTVDAVEVAHGRWEGIEASDELYRCSVCGEWQFIPEEHFAYCPYCGAKMDGGTDDGLL